MTMTDATPRQPLHIVSATEQPPRHFWRFEGEAMLGVTVLLLAIGCLNVFSSSFILAETNFDTPYFFIKRQGLNLAVGFVALLVGACVNYRRWRKVIAVIFGCTVALLLLVLVIGTEVNGARRWIQVGPIPIQPAELAKVVAIFLEAAYISLRIKAGKRCEVFHAQLGLIALMAVLVEREPDGATAAIILGIPLYMLLLSNLKGSTKRNLILAVLSLTVLICVLQPYRLRRVQVMLDPWADATGVGYQTVQSLLAIGSGELWGMGLGAGISKYHYLPEAHTDFAFAIWCQENGFLGALGVLILFGALTYYGCRIANRAADVFGQMLAFGLTCLVSGQAMANLFMVGGWGPVVGVPLPFISYGGSSLVVTMFAVGVIVNVSREREKLQAALPRKRSQLRAAKALAKRG